MRRSCWLRNARRSRCAMDRPWDWARERRRAALELSPKLRMKKSDTSAAFVTDEGNYILDCACGRIEVPEETAAELKNIVGVVEHGLFLGYATLALVASEDGVAEYRA